LRGIIVVRNLICEGLIDLKYLMVTVVLFEKRNIGETRISVENHCCPTVDSCPKQKTKLYSFIQSGECEQGEGFGRRGRQGLLIIHPGLMKTRMSF
jgi:hypothetical protein